MVKEAVVVEGLLARILAPEDVASGQFVMVLNEQHQYITGRCGGMGDPEFVVIEIATRPDQVGMPRMVLESCLPYIVVENLKGGKEVLDVRSSRLALVSDSFVYAAL